MSDYPPPTYEAASYRLLWPIVAPYVKPEDLLSACLVSREWHRSFTPQLWGNPATRFGDDLDAVHFSLARFKRLLPVARLEVRSLTHTLHLRPAEAEFYERPKPVWLRDILDQLPSLKTLITSKVSFFDHQTLQAIHQKYGEPANGIAYRMKMLIAAGCPNTTGVALSSALQHFPDLIFLDLSSSQGVRSTSVLQQIGVLWDLKVLKLRHCGLRDEDAEFVSFPRSLLSLDISDNLFTSRGILDILGKLPQARYGPPSLTTPRYADVALKEKILVGGLEKYVRENLTNRSDGSLRIEEGLPLTFSQLNLVGNYFDIEDITKSPHHLSLDHLDSGSISLNQGNRYFPPKTPQLDPVKFASSFGNLRSLRVHHSIITAFPFYGTEILPSNELERGLESSTKAGSLQLVTHKLLRRQRTAVSDRDTGRLKPSMLPNLKVLILTDLPSKTKRAQTPNSLILFIQECAEAEELARLEYLSQIQDLDRSPNWDFCSRAPLKLQKLVLELSSQVEDDFDLSAQKPTQNKFTKSSTEDQDSEMFIQATEGDFSFFSDNDNSDQLVREGRVNVPAFGYERSMLEARSADTIWLDVVPALSGFRKESRSRFDAAADGKLDFERVISGHWIGEIKVIRV